MNRTYSFYRVETGEVLSMRLCCSEQALTANTPRGCAPIEGEFDHLTQRVDVKTGSVSTFVPAQPDEDHEWVEPKQGRPGRWVLSQAAHARRAAAAEATKSVASEEQTTLRAMRELLLSPDVRALLKRPEDLANLQRLNAADAAIAAERSALQTSAPKRSEEAKADGLESR